jgi:chaperone required for assembly of F1-ATPase
LFYRATSPQGLVERQTHHWDPILDWARQAFGADFELGEGVVYVAQPEAALAAVRAAIPEEPWRLGAVHVVTTLSGSALIAVAMARGALSADAAWQAAHVDEDWNMAQWGGDEMAMARREYRLAEFQAAATVLACRP